MFQDQALFEKMSCERNIAFGLEVRGVPAGRIRERVERMLELVRLVPHRRKLPAQLSGGQRQRVALARALAYEPSVMLFDEPFTALDARTRVELRREVRRILRDADVAALFITHDQEEALELADRILVMNGGLVEQVGSPYDVYNRPGNEFVATFLGAANVLLGRWSQDRTWVLGTALDPPDERPALVEGQPVKVVFRPEDVELGFRRDLLAARHPLSEAVVESVSYVGPTRAPDGTAGGAARRAEFAGRRRGHRRAAARGYTDEVGSRRSPPRGRRFGGPGPPKLPPPAALPSGHSVRSRDRVNEFMFLAVLAVLLVAFLYSSVGHAGASGYIAVLTLLGYGVVMVRPTALLLNVLVASIATWQFWRAGHFSWSLFWPFAILSVPMAFLGGYLQLPANLLAALVGVVLLASAVRFAWRPPAVTSVRPVKRPVALIVGGGIGLLSGLTGTGGGIFLTPILLLSHWAPVRRAAAVSAPFILVNSVAGLAGYVASGLTIPSVLLPLALAAVAGGTLGSYLGSRRFSPRALQALLALVLVIAGTKLILGSVKGAIAAALP